MSQTITEKLRQVTTIVTHHNSPGNPCPDGVASALILHDAIPDARIIFARPSSDELETMVAEPGMLFCDLSPSPSRVKDFVDAGTIVLDHHEKQQDVVKQFGEYGIYASDPGVSGAVLAFREVWLPLWDDQRASFASEVPYRLNNVTNFANMVGIRDTWQKTNVSWAAASMLSEALRFYPWEFFAALPDPFGVSNDKFRSMLAIGEVLAVKQKEKHRNLVEKAYYLTTVSGKHIAIIPSTETSDVAEMIDVDILVGFRYVVTPSAEAMMFQDQKIRLGLSFRSRKGYDVGAIAQKLGGGGHRAAAGATVDGDVHANPYEHIFNLIQQHGV